MDAPTYSALIAGAIALVIAGLSNFGAESYKRHRDAVALAAGLAGELRSYLPAFQKMLESLPTLVQRAAAGQVVPLPKIKRPTSPVFEGNVGRLGVLGADLAERVSFVYANIDAFRSFMEAAIRDDVKSESQLIAFRSANATLEMLKPASALVDALHVVARREWLAPAT